MLLRAWAAADAIVLITVTVTSYPSASGLKKSFGELKSCLQIEKAKENQLEWWSSKCVLEET